MDQMCAFKRTKDKHWEAKKTEMGLRGCQIASLSSEDSREKKKSGTKDLFYILSIRANVIARTGQFAYCIPLKLYILFNFHRIFILLYAYTYEMHSAVPFRLKVT